MPTSSPALVRAACWGVLVTARAPAHGIRSAALAGLAGRLPGAAQRLPPRGPPLHGYWQPTWFGPGTVPAVLLALLGWRYAAGWPPGSRGDGCSRVVRRLAGLAALARAGRRDQRAVARAGQPVRVPPHRPRRRRASHTLLQTLRRPDPLRRRRQLAHPRRRPPAGDPAVLRRPGEGRARRRPGGRASWSRCWRPRPASPCWSRCARWTPRSGRGARRRSSCSRPLPCSWRSPRTP